ncbi:MAG: DegV family protein [Clostridia bacterium]|nr:DegV family protein [Clostridia bacterium]
MKIAIAFDSNSGILSDEAEKSGFFLLPTPILIDDKQYFQDVNLTSDEFYEKLRGGHKVTTSQPSPYSAEKLWTKILGSGYDQILYFPISSGLSTSCYNLEKVAKQKFDGKVFVIDHKRVSVTMRQGIADAKKMVDEGKSPEEIKKWLEDTARYSKIYIMVPSLEYLKRGGRISASKAAIGQLLKIKPVVEIKEDGITQYKNVMTTSQGRKAMIEALRRNVETEFKEEYEAGKMGTAIAHTQCPEEAEEFKAQIVKELPKLRFLCIDELNLSVAAHLGPGALCTGCYIIY